MRRDKQPSLKNKIARQVTPDVGNLMWATSPVSLTLNVVRFSLFDLG